MAIPTSALTAAPSLPAELATAGRQVTELARSGVQAAGRPRTWTWWMTLVVAVWILGVGGDAYTTLAMMGTGLYEEANGVAAAGMNVLGPVGYTVVASLACLAMGTVNLGRPRGKYAVVVLVCLSIAGALKLYTAASNLLLWIAG